MHRVDTTRPQYIHPVRGAELTAMNFHVGVDYHLGNDNWPARHDALGEGERFRVTQ